MNYGTIQEENVISAYVDEEYVWAEGYIGTDANMCHKGFQYSLGKVFKYDDDLSVCGAGFPVYYELEAVFRAYPIGNGNRYFKVRAKVKKYSFMKEAKELEFIEEITITDDIAKKALFSQIHTKYDAIKNGIGDLPEDRLSFYINRFIGGVVSPRVVIVEMIAEVLQRYYSPALVCLMINQNNEDILNAAFLLGPDDSISKELKIALIFTTK